MKGEEILFLNQLIHSLEDTERKLEESYRKKDFENFNTLKKGMIKIQKEIFNIIR
jgi:hypothetical protein